MKITTAWELIDSVLDPNVEPVNVSSALLEWAVELLEGKEFEAVKAGGAEMVRHLRAVRAAAGRLAAVTTDGTERAERAQKELSGIAAMNSDEYILWLLAAAVMTDEQHAAVRGAFA